MLVEELIETLQTMPKEAYVYVQIRMNREWDGTMQQLYEFRPADIEAVVYGTGRVMVQLDE